MDNNEQQAPQSAPAPASTPAPQVTVDNSTLMAILAYLGPLVIIPFLTAKEQPFVKFHIKQGLVLLGLEIVLMVLSSMMFGLWMLVQLINLGLIILSILGIVNVINKKEEELPLVGSLAKNINI